MTVNPSSFATKNTDECSNSNNEGSFDNRTSVELTVEDMMGATSKDFTT